jgi:hypothetical protein
MGYFAGMNPLQSNDFVALSLLINEDIYSVREDEDVPKVVETSSEKPIEPDKEVESVKEEVQKSFNYLGENNKYILIIVKEASANFLQPKDLSFLLKILAAKKLELNDVAILNLEKTTNPNFDSLKEFFACNKMITFGINPQILGISGVVANKKSTFKETPVLGTWDLQKLQADKIKKATFWEELKNF